MPAWFAGCILCVLAPVLVGGCSQKKETEPAPTTPATPAGVVELEIESFEHTFRENSSNFKERTPRNRQNA
jgi:hypothetical protein